MNSGRFSKIRWSDDFLITDEGNDVITVAIGGGIAFSTSAHDRIFRLEGHITREDAALRERLTVLEAELAAATARIAQLESLAVGTALRAA